MEARSWVYWLRRLFALWGVYARLDFLLMTRNLRSFIVWAVSDSVMVVAHVTGMLLLAERFGGVGHWSKPQVYFLLGYASVVDGVLSLFFSYNVVFISRRLGRGQFDHTLIQPLPIGLSLLTEGFSPALGLPMLVPGICLVWVALGQLALPAMGFGWWLLFVVNVVGSVGVIMAFQFAWGSLAFRAPRSAEELSSSTMSLLNDLKQYPLDGLSGVILWGFCSILPVGFVAWLPSRALLGMVPMGWGGWITPLASVCYMGVGIFCFVKGRGYYARVGSQRYSNFGHRC